MKKIIKQNEISLLTIKEIKKDFNINKINSSPFILDFRNVEMIDSEGISWIVSIINDLDKKDIDLRIVNVKKNVYKIFKITMLDSILDIRLG
ncbi:MAG: STAS domain-containing protein [Bacillota bacterium]